MDWIKIAKEIQDKENAQQKLTEEEELIRKDEILQSEKNWADRVLKRVQEISKEGIPVRVQQKTNFIELSQKGSVRIEYKGHRSFEITFRHVRKPTTLILREPINVNHHRLVKLRELNEHNIEEAVKFVAIKFWDSR